MKFTRIAVALATAATLTASMAITSVLPARAAGADLANQTYRFYTSGVPAFQVNNTISSGPARNMIIYVNGVKANAYCADVSVVTPSGDVQFNYDPAKSQQLSSKLSAVLSNGYPATSLQDIAQKYGLNVSENAAITATQAAVWYYTNPGFSITGIAKAAGSGIPGNLSSTDAADTKALYAKLVAEAQQANLPAWSTAELKVDTSKASFSNGRVGPITVSGAYQNTATVKSVSGGTLVYADGSAVGTTIDTTREMYIATSNTSGTASLTVTGNSYVAPGVVLSRPGYQDLVTSQPFGISSEGTGSTTWSAPAPSTTPTPNPGPTPLPQPKVSTLISQQVAAPGATISDTVSVSGTVNTSNGHTVNNTVVGTLWGPVPARRDAQNQLTCQGLDWTSAPKALTWTMNNVTNQNYTNQGQFTIPANAENGQCYTYSETLTAKEASPGTESTTYEHTPGQTSQTVVVEKPVPNPKVTTQINTQLSTPGATISDTVIITGADAYKTSTNTKVDATGQLWGPMPAVNGTCVGIDWSKAPKAGNEFTLTDVKDGSYPNSGSFTIPSNIDGQCYTYSEKLYAYPSNQPSNHNTEVADHPKGESAQTTLVTKPSETPAPAVRTTINAQNAKPGSTISDTITVEGADRYNTDKGTVTDVVVTLYGPMAPINGSCQGIDWTKAPIVGGKPMVVLTNVKDGTTTNVAGYKLTEADAKMCFTYAEKLFAHAPGTTPNYESDTPTYNHTPGQESQTTVTGAPTPKPTVATMVNSQLALPGAQISDTVSVTGANAYNQAEGTKTEVRGVLMGPINARKDAANRYTCVGLDWRNAPVVKQWTMADVKDGAFSNQGTYTIPSNAAMNTCYTYAETLFGYPATSSPSEGVKLYEHTPGIDSQTTLLGTPPDMGVSTVISQQSAEEGDYLTDTVTIFGVDQAKAKQNIQADVVGTLWGPMNPVNGSCASPGVKWSTAPKVGTFTMSNVKNGTFPGQGSFQVPAGSANQCFTYSEQLFVYTIGEKSPILAYDHPAGLETQTKVIPAATPQSSPTIATVVSSKIVKPGDTISDTVSISGIRDTSMTYTVTGALYGPLKANLAVARDKMCEGLDWSKAPTVPGTEMNFRVIQNGDYANQGKFVVPSSTNEFLCYTYGEKLTVEKDGKKVDEDIHAPGLNVQTSLVYDVKFLEREGDLPTGKIEKTRKALMDTSRSLADTGRP